jgi:hypothetical protein
MKRVAGLFVVIVIVTSVSVSAEVVTRSGINKGERETRVVQDGDSLKVTGKVLKLVLCETEPSVGAVVFIDGVVVVAANMGQYIWQLGEIHELRAELSGDIWELTRVTIR